MGRGKWHVREDYKPKDRLQLMWVGALKTFTMCLPVRKRDSFKHTKRNYYNYVNKIQGENKYVKPFYYTLRILLYHKTFCGLKVHKGKLKHRKHILKESFINGS